MIAYDYRPESAYAHRSIIAPAPKPTETTATTGEVVAPPRPDGSSAPGLGEHTLCLVCAWPGTGKTTLLSQWRKQLLVEGRTGEWLSLTAAENEPQRFFAALAAALHGAEPVLGERLRLLLPAGESATAELFAALFCNELASHGDSRITLILDDLYRIHNPGIYRGLAIVLQHRIQGLYRYGALDPVLRAHLAFTRVLRLRGETGRSEALNRHAEDLAEKRHWPRLLGACLAEGIRVRLEQHDITGAAGLLDRLAGFAKPGNNDPRSISLTLGHDYQLSLGRILLARHQPEAAVQVLDEEARLMASTGFHYSATAVQVLLARCHWARGDADMAFAWLKKALVAGSRSGLRRTFLDEAQTLLGMLRAFAARYPAMADGSLDMLYMTALIDAFEAELNPKRKTGTDETRPTDVHGLSRKEREILALVANGLTNKEIANALSVAPGTTKWHLRNVYDKLGVSSRTEAVCEAKALALIP